MALDEALISPGDQLMIDGVLCVSDDFAICTINTQEILNYTDENDELSVEFTVESSLNGWWEIVAVQVPIDAISVSVTCQMDNGIILTVYDLDWNLLFNSSVSGGSFQILTSLAEASQLISPENLLYIKIFCPTMGSTASVHIFSTRAYIVDFPVEIPSSWSLSYTFSETTFKESLHRLIFPLPANTLSWSFSSVAMQNNLIIRLYNETNNLILETSQNSVDQNYNTTYLDAFSPFIAGRLVYLDLIIVEFEIPPVGHLYSTLMNILPEIISPTSMNYYGNSDSSYTLNWTVIDEIYTSTALCTLFLDETIIHSWDYNGSGIYTFNGISSDLAFGEHSWEIKIDDFGIIRNASVVLFHTGNNNLPILSQPEDQSWKFDSKGHNLTWIVRDETIGQFPTYSIMRNETEISSGTWTDEDSLFISLDGLEIGTYKFTCRISDGIGEETVFDIVYVNVYKDSPSPTISWGSATFLYIILGICLIYWNSIYKIRKNSLFSTE